MFRILLHPDRLPRYGMYGGGSRSLLPDGYGWWRARLPTGEYTLCYDNPDNIHEMSLLLFDGDARSQTGEIVDPPALHLTKFLPEYEDIGFGGDLPIRSLMTRGSTAEVDVVCNDCLGERWQWLPGNTCRPGDYQIEERTRRRDGRPVSNERPWDDSTAHVFDLDYPVLNWPLWQVFNHDGTVDDAQLRAAGFVDFGFVDREGFQQSRRRVDEAPLRSVSAILQAIRAFRAAHHNNPQAVLMSPEHERAVLQAANMPELQPGLEGNRIFDLEIRVQRSLPPGRIVMVGSGASQTTEIYNWRGDVIGVLGAPAFTPPCSPNVLPESEVIDEIDRLVNEQVRVGPGDYRINRYDKCKVCGHDWHGLECGTCECINTEWLKK